MKKILTLLLIISSTFLLFSCAKSNNEDIANTLENVKMVDDIGLSNELSYKEIEIEDKDALSNTFMDVEPDFFINVEINSYYLADFDISSAIDGLYYGEDIELDYEFFFTGEKRVCKVFKEGGFEDGGAYTIDISSNSYLKFSEKDNSIRSIIFTVKANDSNDFSLKEYPDYDLSKVTHFNGYDDPENYLFYDGIINESLNDIITFSNSIDKLYIEIISKEVINGKTKIYYKLPDADKIFNECRLHINNKELDMENNFMLNDINDIAKDLVYSDFVLVHLYAITDKYGFSPAVNKLLDIATVNVSFKPEGNKISLGFDVSLTFEFNSGWRLCVSFKFLWTKTFNASADAELETFLGIPTGLKMNCSVSSDESFSYQVLISLKNPKFNVGYQPDYPDNLDFSKAKKAVEELKGKWAEADLLGYKRDKVVGDTMMVNIGYVSLHFGYISIDVELFVCLKLDCNITLGVAYTYSSHQVIINYSSSSGNGDGGASPSNVNAKILEGSIAGTLSTELFLKLKITCYITGIRFLASISADIDAGVYLQAQGLGSISYNFITHEFNGNAAASLEFGFLFRVKLNINVLIFINGSWDLYSKKAPLLKLGASYEVKESAIEELNLNKTETEIKDTNLLVFNVFDASSMSEYAKTFSLDYKVDFLDSVFIDKPYSYNLFKSISTDNEYVKIVGNKIIVDDSIPETTGNIIIELNTSSFSSKEIKIPFKYVSSSAKFVTFDGENKTAYLPGQKIEFPKDIIIRDGYIFKGYRIGNLLYHNNDTFIMPDHDVNFTSYYILDTYYTVTFYDGFGNIISRELVLNEEAAKEPFFNQYQIDGYTFVSWDKDFSFITSDLDVYAIYEKVVE